MKLDAPGRVQVLSQADVSAAAIFNPCQTKPSKRSAPRKKSRAFITINVKFQFVTIMEDK